MYRFQRMARSSQGRFLEAAQWAKEVAEYISENFGVTVTAYSEIFGDNGTLHWYADYESLAQLEQVNMKLNADQQYLNMLEKSVGMFIEGSVHDTLVRSL